MTARCVCSAARRAASRPAPAAAWAALVCTYEPSRVGNPHQRPQQQQQAQAIADATAAGQRMIAMAPQQNLAFFGSQITGLGGGYPQMVNESAAGAGISPTMQALGTLGAIGGAIGGITSLFT